jgi:hypothetical protein
MLMDDRRRERLADKRGLVRHFARLWFDAATGDDDLDPRPVFVDVAGKGKTIGATWHFDI